MMLQKVIFHSLLTCVVYVQAVDNKYVSESGTTEVEVETTFLDTNNSTRKCVNYLTSPPEKYESACFTTIYTDQGAFNGCTVQFDDSADKRCDSCSVCADSNDKQIGFKIDCDNLIPAKSNLNDVDSCTLLNDVNIQILLTDGTTFASVAFDFSLNAASVTDDNDMNTNTGNKTKTSSGRRGSATAWSNIFVVAVVASVVAAL